MKRKRHSIQPANCRPIRTSVLELLNEITALTRDDALALAVFKRIFNSHRVRLTRTLAPVKLIAAATPRRGRATFFANKKWL